jgi:hypothetical protein
MAALGTFLAQVHAWVAALGAALAVLLVAVGTLDGAGIVAARRWPDRLVIAVAAAMTVALLLGPGIVIGVGPPANPVHYLLAALALGAVPALRLVASGRRSERPGWWLAAGGLATLAALAGLWATGG